MKSQECSQSGYRIHPGEGFARAELCTCQKACETCAGRGTAYRTEKRPGFTAEYRVLGPCECRLRRDRVVCFNAAKIPTSLAHARLENFRPSHASLGTALEVAKRFAVGFTPRKPGQKGFLISGPVGTGKSHLAAAALRRLALEAGVRVRFVEMALLFSDIRQGFQEGKSGGEIIAPLAEVEVLAVDELGRGRGSPFEMETLEELVVRRYNQSRPTLFTTNYPLESGTAGRGGYISTAQVAEKATAPESLAARVGARTLSRLHEMCELVQLPMTGLPDQRKLQAKSGR